MSKGLILLAEDDRSIRTVVSHALTREGYDIKSTDQAAQLWQWVEEGLGDLIVTDVNLPDGNGLELIPQIAAKRPQLRIIAMSAQNTLLTAVKASKRGAFEYLPKPFDIADLLRHVKTALASPPDFEPAAGGQAALAPEEEDLPLIGRSPAMQDIYRVLSRLVVTDLTVLVSGESGTGKELVARALHDFSKRRNGPFVALNMGAIPKDLIESELFGHEKGAFTGAVARYLGKFEQAQKGTLFLDEIGDMPPEAQTRLLRVLQEQQITRVGGREAIKSDVRVIAATHRDLRQLVKQGLFREDLFYRLNVVPLRLPPLRERAEDIPLLIAHFATKMQDEGLPPKRYSSDALELLKQQPWPGNVRELENLVRRMAVLHPQDQIDLQQVRAELEAERRVAQRSDHDAEQEGLSAAIARNLQGYFDQHLGGLPSPGLYNRVLPELERPLIVMTLKATSGNQFKAAEVLGLNRNTLRKKIKDLGIEVSRGGV
jgi:two-component system nitrogen regulation response regulator GlnG